VGERRGVVFYFPPDREKKKEGFAVRSQTKKRSVGKKERGGYGYVPKYKGQGGGKKPSRLFRTKKKKVRRGAISSNTRRQGKDSLR